MEVLGEQPSSYAGLLGIGHCKAIQQILERQCNWSLQHLKKYLLPCFSVCFCGRVDLVVHSAWNDFLFAVVLTGNKSWLVTVALQNMAGSQIIAWNVQIAGSLLAAILTLLVYMFLGRYFLRGLMAGSLKG